MTQRGRNLGVFRGISAPQTSWGHFTTFLEVLHGKCPVFGQKSSKITILAYTDMPSRIGTMIRIIKCPIHELMETDASSC